MKIAICDDDPILRQYIANLITDRLKLQNLNLLFYANGSDLVKDFCNQTNIDIVLLDLEMPEMSGQEAARLIRQFDKQTIIIILTSHVEFARYAYELDVHRYILKTEVAEKIGEAIESACKRLENRRRTYQFVTEDGHHWKVAIRHIKYIEYVNRHTVIHTINETYRLKASVPFYEVETALLGTSFVRCYKGLIVNLGAVVSINKKQILLADGNKLPMSRQYDAEVFNAFKHYMEDNHR